MVLTPFKIAESDTQPCTLRLNVHGCVSFLAIMTRLTRAAGGNLHGMPSKPATAPSAPDRAHDQVTQCYDQ
jgi:hypothetical protein